MGYCQVLVVMVGIGVKQLQVVIQLNDLVIIKHLPSIKIICKLKWTKTFSKTRSIEMKNVRNVGMKF